MSQDPHLDDEPPEDAAARWFARLQGESATAEDWQAFERWFRASPEHVRAYEALEALWVDLDYADLALELGRSPAPPARRARRVAPMRRVWIGAGAALAASLAVALVAPGLDRGPAAPATAYRTAPGQTRTLTLADGTRIQLNAASLISVRLDRDARRVSMADAEAVFDVAHDPQRPFLIAVGDRQVRVVGTQFNLRHRDGRVALTVRRGVVEVRPSDALQAAPTRVTVGQQLSHQEGSPTQTLVSTQDGAAFAWTSGQLIYRDQPMAEVAADLSRRFGAPIRTADARTAALRFTGVLVTDDQAAVLRRLQAFAPVRVEHAGGAVVLRRAD